MMQNRNSNLLQNSSDLRRAELPQDSVSPYSPIVDQEAPLPRATILLVEDEDSVRSVTREVLECEGYRVVEAEDAIDGIRVCELFRGKIDIVLTDVVMPGMNGRDMARKLTDAHPGLRVIFMSGYTDNPVLREAFADTSTVYLQKPFTVQTLRDKIRNLLDGQPSTSSGELM